VAEILLLRVLNGKSRTNLSLKDLSNATFFTHYLFKKVYPFQKLLPLLKTILIL